MLDKSVPERKAVITTQQVLEQLETIYLTLYRFANSTFVTLINDFLKEDMSSGAVKYTDITKYNVNMVCVQCRFGQVSFKLQNVMSSHNIICKYRFLVSRYIDNKLPCHLETVKKFTTVFTKSVIRKKSQQKNPCYYVSIDTFDKKCTIEIDVYNAK